MKKLFLVSVIFVLSTVFNTVKSQNLVSQVDVSEIKLPEVKRSTKSFIINDNYLKKTRHSNISKHIEEMRTKVATFNCKDSKGFKGEATLYEVNFKSEKGNILVSFDKEGKIVKTQENFEGIKIPQAVRESVFSTYKNWVLTAVKFHSEYNKNEKEVNYYKVWIQNGTDKMVLKVNSDGVIL